jgi:hypothetical protein
MILLDEQVREDQRDLLSQWGIRHRQIGREMARSGIKDVDIIPWLHSLKRPTFFTHDWWFYQVRLCHAGYCLVWLDLKDIEAARFIRRFLGHPMFKTHAERLGKVVRLHHEGIEIWTRGAARATKLNWP